MDDIDKYAKFLTEQRNLASSDLDQMDNDNLVSLFLNEEKSVDNAMRGAGKELARGIDMLACAFPKGRIFMIGAGTSGRLAVLEAAECPPTFGTDPDKIIAIMAGGEPAVFRSREGAEDDRDAGATSLAHYNCCSRDIVIGIAASGITPFVQGSLSFARSCLARTILITCNPAMIPAQCADLVIGLPVGPEILTGSTRLKAGTATKRALNILTTGTMVRIGKVYQNLMVDVQVSCQKLRARSIRIIAEAAKLDYSTANDFLEKAGGSAKVAIVMACLGVDSEEAKRRLASTGEFLRKALE